MCTCMHFVSGCFLSFCCDFGQFRFYMNAVTLMQTKVLTCANIVKNLIVYFDLYSYPRSFSPLCFSVIFLVFHFLDRIFCLRFSCSSICQIKVGFINLMNHYCFILLSCEVGNLAKRNRAYYSLPI